MKKIEKWMALTVIAAAIAVVGCEKTVEGMKEDAADAAAATKETAKKAVEGTKDAAAKTGEAVKEKAKDAGDAVKKKVNEAAIKAAEATE